MIIHPTRTNLLLLKEKVNSIFNSIGILKARRQALMKEFLNTTLPFIRSREDIKNIYGKALDELALSLGHEGKKIIESVAAVTERDIKAEIVERSIWGLKYKDVSTDDQPVREVDKRGYDFLATTPHMEEGISLFEKILESMIELAAFENKLKRLGTEITWINRKIKVLEEKVMPDLTRKIRAIAQHIGERERETYYRLKRFKISGKNNNKTL